MSLSRMRTGAAPKPRTRCDVGSSKNWKPNAGRSRTTLEIYRFRKGSKVGQSTTYVPNEQNYHPVRSKPSTQRLNSQRSLSNPRRLPSELLTTTTTT